MCCRRASCASAISDFWPTVCERIGSRSAANCSLSVASESPPPSAVRTPAPLGTVHVAAPNDLSSGASLRRNSPPDAPSSTLRDAASIASPSTCLTHARAVVCSSVASEALFSVLPSHHSVPVSRRKPSAFRLCSGSSALFFAEHAVPKQPSMLHRPRPPQTPAPSF